MSFSAVCKFVQTKEHLLILPFSILAMKDVGRFFGMWVMVTIFPFVSYTCVKREEPIVIASLLQLISIDPTDIVKLLVVALALASCTYLSDLPVFSVCLAVVSVALQALHSLADTFFLVQVVHPIEVAVCSVVMGRRGYTVYSHWLSLHGCRVFQASKVVLGRWSWILHILWNHVIW